MSVSAVCCTNPTQCLCLPPVALTQYVVWFGTAQNAAPAYFPYDCRRSNVGCGNDGLCNPADGQCLCNASYAGDDCMLASDTGQ